LFKIKYINAIVGHKMMRQKKKKKKEVVLYRAIVD